MIIITRKDLKKRLNKAQETIKMLNQELLEANQGMIALTLELKQAQEEYKNIFENSIVGIYRATIDHHFKMVNPALAELLEYESPDNLINNTSNINEEIYIDTVKRRKFIHHLFKKGSVVDHESQVRSKKGKNLWILENASLLKDEHSNITGYEAIVQDINKKKKIE